MKITTAAIDARLLLKIECLSFGIVLANGTNTGKRTKMIK